jgi:predicted transcriptional regulator
MIDLDDLDINGRAKLTPHDVQLIVELREKHGVKVKDIAEKFEVHQKSVYRILSGELWTHVTGRRYEKKNSYKSAQHTS